MKSKSRAKKSVRKQRLLKALKVLAVALVVLACLAAAGFYFFQGWRARDLASKAVENFEHGNFRIAWLQINSARDVRADSPAVLRASAMIESGFGMRSGFDFWNRLAAIGGLTTADLEPRARAAARFGTDEQFEQAARELEASGDKSAARRLRSARQLLRGNMDKAIDELRSLVSEDNDPLMKLDLAKLLLQRHADDLARVRNKQSEQVATELIGIVNSLLDTPASMQALAFGLTFLLPGQSEQARWARVAMDDPQPSNPALLPAATVMIDLGKANAAEMHLKLRPVFDAAPLDRRAAFSVWLTRHGMPREALSLITSQESAESGEAFYARVEALAKLENWNALIETAEVGGNVPDYVRLVSKARAEYALGRGAQSGAKSVGDAMRSSARAGALPAVVQASDAIGAGDVVDSVLVELSGVPGVAPRAFRLAKERFSLRGTAGTSLLSASHQRALAVAPDDVSVQDYSRYVKMLDFMTSSKANTKSVERPLAVDPAETAAAVASEPSDTAIRATHALALLQAGHPGDALSAFGDITLFFGRMPPGSQAVICAALAASGRQEDARRLAKAIDQQLLVPGEKELIKDLR